MSKSVVGKRAVPRHTLKITPSSFPGAKHALARLAGKPIRNQKRRSK